MSAPKVEVNVQPRVVTLVVDDRDSMKIEVTERVIELHVGLQGPPGIPGQGGDDAAILGWLGF